MPKTIAYDIIENNKDFVAVDKASGLLSIPDRMGKEPSLKVMLQEEFGKIFTIHRLDKDTSGLILFAKTEEAHKELSVLFETRAIDKYYLGLIYGNLQQTTGLIDVPIRENSVREGIMMTHAKGKPSQTEYEVLESFKGFSWVKFKILTGRTHQIRVHTNHLGSSILVDELYGNPEPILLSQIKRKYKPGKYVEEQPIINRLALHSWQLQFTFNEQTYHLETPIPKMFKAFLQQMRKLN